MILGIFAALYIWNRPLAGVARDLLPHWVWIMLMILEWGDGLTIRRKYDDR